MPSPRVVLLDIEGTVAPISFVYDILFPFARTRLRQFLAAHWNDEAVAAARRLIEIDSRKLAGRESETSPLESEASLEQIQEAVIRMMDADAKTTGLKQLQGLIWQEGYEQGNLRSQLFDDVAPALRRWHAARLSLAIYSSGSVAAQKVFFRFTTAGDLTPLLGAHFDTTIGPKRAAASYRAIALQLNVLPEQVLFLTDVPEEADAARQTGMHTAISIRPGNAPVRPQENDITFSTLQDLSI